MIRKTIAQQVTLCGVFYPAAPKQTASASRRLLPDHGLDWLRDRDRRAVPDYYRSAPGYQPTEKSRIVDVSLDPDRTNPGQRYRGYYDDEDAGRHQSYARSVRQHDDDDWALDDSTLSHQEFLKLNPTYWGGFRDMLATELMRLLQRRDEEFQQYEGYAEDLEQDVGCPDLTSLGWAGADSRARTRTRST